MPSGKKKSLKLWKIKKVVLILKLIMKLFFSGINSIPNISGIYNLRSMNAVSGNGKKHNNNMDFSGI